MVGENNKDFTKQLFQAYTTFSSVGGESGGKFAEYAFQAYGDMRECFYPFETGKKKATSSKDRTARDTAMVEKMFAKFGKKDKPKSGKPSKSQE